MWTAGKSQIAREALDRIGKLYDIEREIAGKSAELRLAARKKYSADKVAAFKVWAEQQLTRIPGKSDLAKAFRYALNRWSSFMLFLDDGRLAIDNNAAERAMRPIGVGRKNWLFAGPDTGGETLARAMTLIESAKMNRLDPQACLADALDRIHEYMSNRLYEQPCRRAAAVELDAQGADHARKRRRLILQGGQNRAVTTGRRLRFQPPWKHCGSKRARSPLRDCEIRFRLPGSRISSLQCDPLPGAALVRNPCAGKKVWLSK